jgi:aldose 1-epimerase
MNSISLSRIIQQNFGQLISGEVAQLFILENAHGTKVKITNFGGIITAIETANQQGNFNDIVLGYDNVSDYEKDPYYLGAVIGRYAGRFDQGQLIINDTVHQLTLNAPDSQLHGGAKALNKQLWQYEVQQDNNSAQVILSYTSPDGEEGFPGNVDFKVIYQLNDKNELSVEYFASTDKTTAVNLTQHSYFNLAGHNSGDILNHQVTINADHFLPMTERAYPTGEIKSVSNTPHDFRQARVIADDINGDDEQIKIGLGYDNYWLLNEEAIKGNEMTAQAFEPTSGRRVTLFSDQPSMILYTANYIDGSQTGKDNCCYQTRAALCLETQRANSLQHGCDNKNFLLSPEESFYSKTRFVFDCI